MGRATWQCPGVRCRFRSLLPMWIPICASLAALGCTSLASSPEWTGGGLATLAPARAAEVEAAEERERARIARQPKEVGARHILVMHEKSRDRPDNIKRTREEALRRTQECLVKVRSGEDWGKLVKEYSDEPGAGERDGSIGVFGRGQMVKAFSDAAFDLRVGQVSEVVETPYGFHVIQRTQ
jgi:NIMA-interacting peptidyl-prolyl cis-trans isomerase 1